MSVEEHPANEVGLLSHPPVSVVLTRAYSNVNRLLERSPRPQNFSAQKIVQLKRMPLTGTSGVTAANLTSEPLSHDSCNCQKDLFSKSGNAVSKRLENK